jgi:CHRD domain
MRPRVLLAALASVAVIALMVAPGLAGERGKGRHGDRDGDRFSAHLDGYQEVPTLSSPGRGKFRAEVDDGEIDYRLSYTGLTGVTAAHIHLGRPAVNGGVIAFLCGGGGKPACPASAGTVTGTIVAADIMAIAAQGLAAGDFDAAVDALDAEAVYVNVHTAAFPMGEIRGDIED